MIRAVTLETPTLNRALAATDTNALQLPNNPAFRTPSNSPPEDSAVMKKSTCTKTVQFGMAFAAEYVKDCPPKELTPMPTELAKERFPLTEPPRQEEATEETKHNSATLAEWDDDFESYLSSDDEDESSSGEELESMLFSRKRKSRRSSGFFSPDTSALLLPSSQEQQEMRDDDNDLSTDVNMASLAVRSPLACENSIMEEEETTTDVDEYELLPASKRLDLSPLQSNTSMDTTPPSDYQLSSVNSTGGATLADAPREASAPMISSRQLHGALERCVAQDENVSTVLASCAQEHMKAMGLVLTRFVLRCDSC